MATAQTSYLPFLKGVAVVGSLWNAGSMTTSWRLLPSIYPTARVSRRAAANEWAFHYSALSKSVPLTDLVTILVCGGIAYTERKRNLQPLDWKLWATATSIVPLGWIWVWTLMLEPSKNILAISEVPDSVVDDTHLVPSKVVDLFKQFNSLMGVRMLFPWAVGGLALWASLDS